MVVKPLVRLPEQCRVRGSSHHGRSLRRGTSAESFADAKSHCDERKCNGISAWSAGRISVLRPHALAGGSCGYLGRLVHRTRRPFFFRAGCCFHHRLHVPAQVAARVVAKHARVAGVRNCIDSSLLSNCVPFARPEWTQTNAWCGAKCACAPEFTSFVVFSYRSIPYSACLSLVANSTLSDRRERWTSSHRASAAGAATRPSLPVLEQSRYGERAS